MNYYKFWFIIKFKAKKNITNLPLYTGIHWHAFFEEEFKGFSEQKLSELDINVVPTGRRAQEYKMSEEITVNIATNQKGKTVLEKWLKSDHNKNIRHNSRAHFVLDKTVSLVTWNLFEFEPNFDYDFENQSGLTLVFSQPLRLKRDKKDFGRFFDPFHFDFREFLRKLASNLDLVLPDLSKAEVTNKFFLWLDIKYSKSLGGVIGGLKIEGKLSNKLLQLLHYGQFYGVGKNRSFGFGFYYIRENPNPIFRSAAYSDEHSLYEKLRKKLVKQKKKVMNGKQKYPRPASRNLKFLKMLCQNLLNNEDISQLLINPQKQNKGTEKNKYIDFSQIHQLLSEYLLEVIENNIKKLLTFKDYLYKMNYNAPQTANQLQKEFDRGFNWGVKYQINSLFDATILTKIKLALESLRVNREILILVEEFFKGTLKNNEFLDIMLSNLILLPLEQWINRRKNLKLVRYMGTFVIIGRNISREKYIKPINLLLRTLELDFEIAKLGPRSEIEFLDYTISSSGLKK